MKLKVLKQKSGHVQGDQMFLKYFRQKQKMAFLTQNKAKL
jgi:hypothetical protein